MLDLLPVGGGVVGVVAGIASQFIKGKNDKVRADAAVALKDASARLVMAKAEAGVQETTAETAQEETKGYYEARREQEITSRVIAENTYPWVNAVRALVRPILTVIALVLGAIVTDPEKVTMYTTMGSMAFGWWFTERAVATRENK